MARQGTPNAGLDEIVDRVYVNGADFTLVAYTNAHDSLGANTLAVDLTQPTSSNGYAPIVLTGTWSSGAGVATYVHPAGAHADSLGNPTWFASGAWSAGVKGVALLAGTRVLHFMDHRDGNGDPATFTAAAGKRLTVDMSSLLGS